MKRYFISGGAGFVGSHMLDALIGKGYITIYDNLCSGKIDFIQRHLDSPSITFVQGDLGDLDLLKQVMKGHDIAFHFAANPDIARSMSQTDLDLKEGTVLTYNVLEAMRVNGVKKIVYSSGSGVYGDVGHTPTAENFAPLFPISMYGASKLASEGLISAFCYSFNMQGYIFRIANVVGGRQTHGVGYDFIRKLQQDSSQLTVLGDGSQSKSYIHVSDLVNAMLYVLDFSSERVNLFNVATGDYITVKEIAQIVIDAMGLKDVALHFGTSARGWKGDVPVVRFVLDKIYTLGWRPRHSSRQAVIKSIQEMLGCDYADGNYCGRPCHTTQAPLS